MKTELPRSMMPRFLGAMVALGALCTTVPGAESTGEVELPELPAPVKFDTHVKSAAVTSQPLVFVARKQYPGDHHNTATMFQTGEINTGKFRGPGSIKMLDFDGGEVITLLHVPQGLPHDLDVHFDGKRILFSMRLSQQDDYHIYEMDLSGKEGTYGPADASLGTYVSAFPVKPLTFGAGISDIDPIYLPSGQIVFGSTREPKFCMCNRHIMANLFSMDGDGANVQQIGHSTLHEGHSSVMPDGRILYDRWEYVDRNFGDAQGVWSTNPDGTNHAVYWGNNTNSPGAVLDNHIIPGTELLLCTFSSCHDRPWGALAIVDRRQGLDGREPVVRTWPAAAIDLVGKGNYDTFRGVKPKYEDPYPLNKHEFLCVRTVDRGDQTGIYLLDMDGGEALIHAEAPGCFDPLPLASRPRPPVIPARIDLTSSEGYFYIADVYQGLGMDVIEPGTIKSVRVVESPEKRYWTSPAWNGGTGQQAPGMAWNDFNNKRILGTAPVEKDGSAFFAVPADTYVYFQLLDDQGMMVQSMRCGTIVRPGETAGCIGCHEDRRGSVTYDQTMAATKRAPQKLQPWYGEPRLYSYTGEVQPVLDKHCVSCHDYGKEAGEKLNLAGDRGILFNTSYCELRNKKKMINVPGAGPYQILMPKTWGSHVSRLGKVALAGHGKEEIDSKYKLDKEGFDRIVTWIDINAPYYPSYASAYRNNMYGRSPLDGGQLARLKQLTGQNTHGTSINYSFDRPEISPALSKFKNNSDPGYKEALAILQAGKQALAERPRADMPGFELVDPIEIEQEAKYQARVEYEAKMRTVIAAGKKRYDQQPPEG